MSNLLKITLCAVGGVFCSRLLRATTFGKKNAFLIWNLDRFNVILGIHQNENVVILMRENNPTLDPDILKLGQFALYLSNQLVWLA